MKQQKKSVLSGSHWGIFHAEVEDGRVTGVRPFEKDPAPTPLIQTIPSIVHGEARISQPMVRAGFHARGRESDGRGRGAEPFVKVSWDEALDLVAGELSRVKREHGNQAIFAGSYGWGGPGKFQRAKNHLHRMLGMWGGYTGSVSSYSFAAGMIIVPRILGTLQPIWGPHTSWASIAEAGELLVSFGGLPAKNMQIDHGGAVHTAKGWLERIKQRGVGFVNIGPNREDMEDFLEADWLPSRPGTDTALMLALAHTLHAEGLHDQAFLEGYCVGFEAFLPYLTGESDGTPKDADWAAPITEIPAETIRGLARRMAGARTMINVSWSVQRGDHGEQPFWMGAVLAAMLGQIGLPGGGIAYGYGVEGSNGNPHTPLPAPGVSPGQNPIDSFIPCARITDMLLDPGGDYDFNGERRTYPDIRLIYWVGGNVFHHHQDLNRLLGAWARPETIIIQDPWWTPAAKRADIVLPAATQLESNDIGGARGQGIVYAMQKAVEPVGRARTDFSILEAIAKRLGLTEKFGEGRSEAEWLRHVYDLWRQKVAEAGFETPSFDAFWKAGHVEFPEPDEPYVLFADFRADPTANPLNTPSGKIEIYSETIAGFGYQSCGPHPVWMEPREWLGAAETGDHPLHLISNQSRWRLHSQADSGSVSRANKIDGREAIQINPTDAAVRAIEDGAIVRVYNHRGSCLAGARISEAVRPGVVALATGAWFDPLDPADIGSLDKHGNPNVLTRDEGTSQLAQGPVAQSTLVEIELHQGPAPEITAFTPPPTVAAAE